MGRASQELCRFFSCLVNSAAQDTLETALLWIRQAFFPLRTSGLRAIDEKLTTCQPQRTAMPMSRTAGGVTDGRATFGKACLSMESPCLLFIWGPNRSACSKQTAEPKHTSETTSFGRPVHTPFCASKIFMPSPRCMKV